MYTSNRANRLISMFSPIVPDSSARSVSIVLPSCSGLTEGWLSSTMSTSDLFHMPSAILSTICSGLPSAIALPR